MPKTQAVIIGIGSYLPEKTVTNDDFAKTLETSDAWIYERTGIKRRHFAADAERTSDLAVKAAQAALEHAGIAPDTLDALILATATPDQTFPSTATQIQSRIGMNKGFAFDLAAVCTGFIYALGVADSLIQTGMARRIMVIGAETFSRILDFSDRTTCVLFGDGAGAVILEAQENTDRGILASTLHSDGQYNNLLHTDGGISSTQTAGFVRMKGREVFKHAVNKLAETTEDALAKAGLSDSDLDWIVPHQANIRIIKATAEKMGTPMERVIQTVEDHGNTSAASIPLALDTAVRSGKIMKNQVIAVEAIGGGLTWGAVIIRM